MESLKCDHIKWLKTFTGDNITWLILLYYVNKILEIILCGGRLLFKIAVLNRNLHRKKVKNHCFQWSRCLFYFVTDFKIMIHSNLLLNEVVKQI
jgi:hypothetical protein